MKTRLEELEEEIREIKRMQLTCDHDWAEIEYVPEKVQGTRQVFRYQGSDSYYDLEGTGIYYDKPRWCRTCKKCGKKEYTYETEEYVEQKIIKRETRPKFR